VVLPADMRAARYRTTSNSGSWELSLHDWSEKKALRRLGKLQWLLEYGRVVEQEIHGAPQNATALASPTCCLPQLLHRSVAADLSALACVRDPR
jgi:hypothetical protein